MLKAGIAGVIVGTSIRGLYQDPLATSPVSLHLQTLNPR